MKKFSFMLAVSFALIFLGCGGGGSDSSGNDSAGDGNSVSKSYSIDSNSNNGIMGPLKGATVKIYKLSDLTTAIEEINTNDLGAFTVNLSSIDDDEMLMVSISGGEDVDADDDGLLDDAPTTNSGTIRGLAKARELKNGSVNITLLSEILYTYVQHLIGEVHFDDLEEAMNVVSAKLLKSSINRDTVSYRDINNFVPTKQDLREKLDFDYLSLIGEDSLSSLIHSNQNRTSIKENLNSLFSHKLVFNSNDILRNSRFYKIQLVPTIESNIESIGSTLFVKNDDNSSKLTDYVIKDSNISFSIALNDTVKLTGWNGCDTVSADGLTCSINNISTNRQVIPSVIYKESILNDNVKDITDYFVTQNDNNYTISLDLGADTSRRNFVENIETDNIIVSNGTSQRFSRKVLSKIKVDDYNYVFETEEVSILDVFSQAGISYNKNLTHDNLVNEDTINRSLRAKGMQLLPPRFKGDDLFTIAPIPSSSNNRSLEEGATWKIWENENKTQSVSIQGKLSFKLKPMIDINTRFLDVKSVKIAYQMKNIGEVRLIATNGFNIEKKLSLLDLIAGHIITGDNVIDDGWEPKGLKLNILLPYFKATVSVPIFIGVEGSANTAFSVGVGWNTIENIGMQYSNGETSIIKSSTRNYKLLGEMLGSNMELSVGAFIEPWPSIVFYNLIGLGVHVKTGPYLIAKIGAEYDEDLQAGATFKVNANIGLIPEITTGSLMPNSARVFVNDINTKFLANVSLSASRTIWESSSTENNPSYLEVSTVAINEILYTNQSYISDYVFEIRNTGDEELNWSLSQSGTLPGYLDISKVSGTLEAGDSESITISANINDLTELAGRTWSGVLKFSNDDNEENYVQESISAEIKVHLSAPENPVNVSITGNSIKKFYITRFSSYQWPESVNRYDVENGFKFYISDYNDTSASCDESSTSFLASINYSDNTQNIDNDYLTINFEDVKRTHNIEGGKKYCIRHLAYYGNTESPENDGNIAVYVPEYGTLSSAIKDNNNNPIDATIRLTRVSNNTSSDGNGNFVFESLMPGKYRITIEAEGYITKVIEEFEIASGPNVLSQFLTSSIELEDTLGTITGKVKNALTGDGVAEVTIKVRAGLDNQNGEVLSTFTSDDSGDYSIATLSTGDYTLDISKEGFVATYKNIYVVGDESNTEDILISPTITSGEMRIVLGWGDNPRDLDSHLLKKIDGNIDYHISYHQKVSGGDSLDYDYTQGQGPETVTISDLSSTSTYTYYVYHYAGESTLKDSGAVVNIYYGNNVVPYTVPNEDGKYWKVFDIINGVITPCLSDCIRESEFDGVNRSVDRELNEERNLFKNLPKK